MRLMEEQLTYEQAMQKLEALASQMERSEIGIDEMADRLRQAQELMNCNSLLNIEEKE